MGETEQKTFHVLALSGGGARALYSATILRNLEEAAGKPLAKHFDLICGTSAGGLLAMGLASGISAEGLQQMFFKDASKIFAGKPGWFKKPPFWFSAKHSNAGLRTALTEKFQDKTIGNLKHRVLVPTVNFTMGLPQVFKTPHHPNFAADVTMPLVDVGMATTAAPTYFPLFKHARGTFVDGGLVANSPGLLGLHEIRQFVARDKSVKVRVLSIGTISIGSLTSSAGNPDKGVKQWGRSLLDLVISAQEASTDNMLGHLLGDDYLRVDVVPSPGQTRDVGGLDIVTAESFEVLIQLGNSSSQQLLGNPKFKPFIEHVAEPAAFYHGPNKNTN